MPRRDQVLCKKNQRSYWRLLSATFFSARAQNFEWLYCLYDVNFFFHFTLRRETGSAVSRSSEEKSYYRNMKPSWICVFLILTLLGFMSASGDSKTEGKCCQSLKRNHLLFQSGMRSKKGSKCVLKKAVLTLLTDCLRAKIIKQMCTYDAVYPTPF